MKNRPTIIALANVACVVVVAALSMSAAAADVPAAVTLSGQRVRLDAEKHELEVDVTVHNDLDVALSAVDVGWLLAPTATLLEGVRDPGPLYLEADDPKRVVPPAGVTVLRRLVGLAIAPHGSAVATFAVGAASSPAVYRTHVLGYSLADGSLPLMMRLLHGSAAADEKAAVDYFALAGDAADRSSARRRLGDTASWVEQLPPRAVAAIPQRPSPSEAHERIYIVRALGVVGGQRAESALAALRDRSELAVFDDFVRVLLIERLRGTRLETPLAFAVPASARSMRDVVDAALADVRDLPGQVARAKAETILASAAIAGAQEADADTTSRSATAAASPTPAVDEASAAAQPVVSGRATDTPPPKKSFIHRVVPWGACLLAFIITMRLLNRRSRR